MGSKRHLTRLREGVEGWNKWREEHPKVRPNLAKADLFNVDLSKADLSKATLVGANLAGADLSHVDLIDGDLTGADLSNVNLSHANLFNADLSCADLSCADLSNATLAQARLIGTRVGGATFTGCSIYGISVWDIKGEPKEQNNLEITNYFWLSPSPQDPIITVDNLLVAQFINTLIHYPELNKVIDTITSKVVLILGRFTDERKPVLNAIRDKLREYDYVPVLFDFDKPESRSFIATVSTIAHMARFVIADFTDPKIVLQEVPHIAPIGVPILPLLQEGQDEPPTLPDLRNVYRTILDTRTYKGTEDLLQTLRESVIEPSNARGAALIASNKRESERIIESISAKKQQSAEK